MYKKGSFSPLGRRGGPSRLWRHYGNFPADSCIILYLNAWQDNFFKWNKCCLIQLTVHSKNISIIHCGWGSADSLDVCCIYPYCPSDESVIPVQNILPYPMVLPQLVFREDGWGDVASLVLFSGLLHCFLVAFLGLNTQIVKFKRHGAISFFFFKKCPSSPISGKLLFSHYNLHS